MLSPGYAVAQTMTLPNSMPHEAPNLSSQPNRPTRYFPSEHALPRATQDTGTQSQVSNPNTAPPPVNSTRYAPLQQVLSRVTKESGVQIKTTDPTMLKEEVPVNESGPNRNLDLEPVLEGFSRIELYGDDSELKKVILMNRNEGASSQAPTVTANPRQSRKKSGALSTRASPAQKRVAPPTSQTLPNTKLSQAQLQTLIRGAYRSPLPEELWDNYEYQEFLMEQGIASREDMGDRNKAKDVRKTVRRLLWKLKNKPKQ